MKDFYVVEIALKCILVCVSGLRRRFCSGTSAVVSITSWWPTTWRRSFCLTGTVDLVLSGESDRRGVEWLAVRFTLLPKPFYARVFFCNQAIRRHQNNLHWCSLWWQKQDTFTLFWVVREYESKHWAVSKTLYFFASTGACYSEGAPLKWWTRIWAGSTLPRLSCRSMTTSWGECWEIATCIGFTRKWQKPQDAFVTWDL